MPSFDIVSEVDAHELRNTVDQVKRELETRFDFRGVEAEVILNDTVIELIAPEAFQAKQMEDILQAKALKRGIDPASFEFEEPETTLAKAKIKVQVKQGIDKVSAKKIVQLLKGSKIKVQSAIQGDEVRVTGKKRDDLQEAIALLKEAELDLPIDFQNFRD